jgi:hypothetical protein
VLILTSVDGRARRQPVDVPNVLARPTHVALHHAVLMREHRVHRTALWAGSGSPAQRACEPGREDRQRATGIDGLQTRPLSLLTASAHSLSRSRQGIFSGADGQRGGGAGDFGELVASMNRIERELALHRKLLPRAIRDAVQRA